MKFPVRKDRNIQYAPEITYSEFQIYHNRRINVVVGLRTSTSSYSGSKLYLL